GPMLAHVRAAWPHPSLSIYVGVYPNDLGTMVEVSRAASHDPRIRMVVNNAAGPTTKGACLNRLWQAMLADRKQARPDVVLVQDAEDVVHPAALAALSDALRHADYAQLPVTPFMVPGAGWVQHHYGDEFAESHAKELPVRAALGAAMPTAGVGCAFRVTALQCVASAAGPFPEHSLTEDYELGFVLHATGARAVFVERRDEQGAVIGTQSLFPATIADAVRQKTRWLQGNALDAWDNMGWPRRRGDGPWQRGIDRWMLWRDRRAIVSALVIVVSYLALTLGLMASALAWLTDVPLPSPSPTLAWLAIANTLLIGWRMVMRGGYVARLYGWRQGVFAVLRLPLINILLVMTAWRGLLGYVMRRRGGPAIWHKTRHDFPATLMTKDAA
ncbi:MAG: glycosyltransferase, partial [Sphingopyxis sp.]|nr:glycosyltransferase [Sphingopyxis sp.]